MLSEAEVRRTEQDLRRLRNNQFWNQSYPWTDKIELNKKTLVTLLLQGFLKINCDPSGARTQDPILKRDVLYLLS